MSKERFWQSYQWNFNNFLFIPTARKISKNRSVLKKVLQDTMGTSITHEAVFGNAISAEDLFKLVRSISCTNWLLFLSKISAFFSNKNKYTPELQTNLAKMIFPDELIGKIEELTKGDYNGISLNIWQIATLAKMALLESELQTEDPNELINNREIIAKCLLGINDYISYVDFNSRFSKSDEIYYPLLESLIRVYSFQLSENPKNVLSRYYDLFIKLPSTPQAASIKNHIIIKDLFESLLKFPLDLFSYLDSVCLLNMLQLGKIIKHQAVKK